MKKPTLDIGQTLAFPEHFLWGTALSAHQAEGGNDRNDWWRFEAEPGRIARGDRSGFGNDHFHRFREDFGLFRGLGSNAVRLSLEWSRIVPEEGRVDHRAVDHYKAVLDAARAVGLEPFVTAHHFTSPQWFAREGGFAVARNLDAWRRFVETIARALGDRVRFWNTINEPAVYAESGWVLGEFPPGVKGDVETASKVLEHLVLAHGHAYNGFHEFSQGDALVGLVKNLPVFAPADPEREADHATAGILDEWFNESVLRAVETGVWRSMDGTERRHEWLAGTTDFWGVNYYMTLFADGADPLDAKPARPGERTTQMGWGVHPEGLTASLRRAAAYGRPVYVTENGCATDDEAFRIEYVARHLAAVHAAIAAGADVRGYFHWTGVDNFEWARGWEPHFGLAAFDPQTFERTVKRGGEFYAAVAGANALTPDVVERFLRR